MRWATSCLPRRTSPGSSTSTLRRHCGTPQRNSSAASGESRRWPPSADRAAISTRSKPYGSKSSSTSAGSSHPMPFESHRELRFPVSVKGVLLEADRVVLLLNDRDEWELPGGRLERSEDPVACLKREFAEELGAEIVVERILDCW